MLPTFTGEVESAGYDIEGDTWAKGCVDDVIHTQSHRHTYINDTHKQTHVHLQIACKKCLYQKFRTLGSEREKKTGKLASVLNNAKLDRKVFSTLRMIQRANGA